MPSIEAATAGDPVARGVYILLIIFGMLIYFNRRGNLSDFIRANQALLILYAYVLLTITWSDLPWISLKRYVNICGSLLMAFIVVSEEDHHKALEHIFRRYAAIGLALSLFYVKTNRSIGYVIGVHGEHFMAGIASHKNELGILCMFSLVLLIWRALRLWPQVNYFDVFFLLIALYLLIRAECQTALVLSILGTALMIGIKAAKGNLNSIVISL